MSAADNTTADPKTQVHSILTDLDAALASHTSPTNRSAADAQRAMSTTDAWKPAFNRRQSWNKEEHKHEQHMEQVGDVKTGPGFSERGEHQG